MQILENRLENVLYDVAEDAGRDMGLDVKTAIDIRHAQDVVVRDNTVVETGVPPAP